LALLLIRKKREKYNRSVLENLRYEEPVVNNIFYDNPNGENPEILYAEPNSPMETTKAIYDLSYEVPIEELYTLANQEAEHNYSLATNSTNTDNNTYTLAT